MILLCFIILTAENHYSNSQYCCTPAGDIERVTETNMTIKKFKKYYYYQRDNRRHNTLVAQHS